MEYRHSEIDIPVLDDKGLRKYGFTMGVIVGILFGLLLPWLLEFSYPWWPWTVSAAFWVFAIFVPGLLRPIHLVWMKLGILIGKITSPIFMGIVFFLVFTPMALLLKLLSKDPLNRALEKKVETYRKQSNKSTPDRITRPF